MDAWNYGLVHDDHNVLNHSQRRYTTCLFFIHHIFLSACWLCRSSREFIMLTDSRFHKL